MKADFSFLSKLFLWYNLKQETITKSKIRDHHCVFLHKILFKLLQWQQTGLSRVSDPPFLLHNAYCVFHVRHGDSPGWNPSVTARALSGDSHRGNSKWRMAATAHWWARDDRQSLTQALRTRLLTSRCRPRGTNGLPWNPRTSVDRIAYTHARKAPGFNPGAQTRRVLSWGETREKKKESVSFRSEEKWEQ